MAIASNVSTKKSMKFEDLVAWQKARQMAKEIYLATSKNAFSRDFALRDQIRRAAVSTMSNLAEGFDRGGRAEFHQFLVIAKGSCAEVSSQLYIADDVGYLSGPEFNRLFALADEVARIVGALKASVANQRNTAK